MCSRHESGHHHLSLSLSPVLKYSLRWSSNQLFNYAFPFPFSFIHIATLSKHDSFPHLFLSRKKPVLSLAAASTLQITTSIDFLFNYLVAYIELNENYSLSFRSSIRLLIPFFFSSFCFVLWISSLVWSYIIKFCCLLTSILRK